MIDNDDPIEEALRMIHFLFDFRNTWDLWLAFIVLVFIPMLAITLLVIGWLP